MTVREQLNAMNGSDLEAVVAAVWEARGWEVKHEGNGDRGVDVRASKADPYPETEVIQVKYRGPDEKLGSLDVQQYTGLAKQENADKALLVTNTTFTEEAYERAERTNLKLINGETLADLITSNGPPERYEPYLEITTPPDSANDPDPIAELAEVALDRTRGPDEREHAINVLGNFGEEAVPVLARIANTAEGSTENPREHGERLRKVAREQINEITE